MKKKTHLSLLATIVTISIALLSTSTVFAKADKNKLPSEIEYQNNKIYGYDIASGQVTEEDYVIDTSFAQAYNRSISLGEDFYASTPEYIPSNDEIPPVGKIISDSIPMSLRLPESMRGIVGSDDRIRITNTTSQPYYRIGHVITWFDVNRNGIRDNPDKYGAGTGFMEGPDLVVTAGHVVYNRDLGMWSKETKFYPGRNGNVSYIEANANQIFSNGYWTNTSNPHDTAVANDWAAIILDRNVGRSTGWFGKAWTTASIVNKAVSITGYPSSNMMTDSGIITSHENNNTFPANQTIRFSYNIDATSGQSGAPVYDSSGYVWGIHAWCTYDSNNVTDYNTGTRFGSWLYNFLEQKYQEGMAKYY